MAQKKKTYRSKKYTEFVRRFLKCCVGEDDFHSRYQRCQGEIVPHHTEPGGMGMKGSDLSCVPLCNFHHQLLHDKGKRSFSEIYTFEPYFHVRQTNQAYIEYLEGK